jgi:anti-anti-sigma regulatory factor
VTQNEERATLQLDGSLGIEVAAELKQKLVEALSSGCALCVSLVGATDMDITAAQLIRAAKIQATATAVSFELIGVVPESIRMALDQAGLGVKFLITGEETNRTSSRKV